MFKILLKSSTRYKQLSRHQFIRQFVVFDVSKLETIRDHEEFIQAIDHIRLSNGTYKTTSVKRFSDIDQKLINLLDKQHACSIHDLAVSDGSTSCELYESLQQGGVHAQIQTSDKFSYLTAYSFPGVRIFYDTDNKLVYGSFFGIVADKRLSFRFLLSKLFGYILPAKIKNAKGEKISLLSPMLKKYLPSKMSFKEVDIFNTVEMQGNFDIVRCMNVLNRSYFSDDMIKVGLKNLRQSVKTGGLLIIGRTDVLKNKNYASIFRINNLGAEELASFGGGSEVADLVFTVFGRVVQK